MSSNPRDFLAALRAKKSDAGIPARVVQEERAEMPASPCDADLVTVADAVASPDGELICAAERIVNSEPVAAAAQIQTGTALRILSVSSDAEKKARRKALFCDMVFRGATHGVTLEQAAAVIATENDWSDVTHGGKPIITVETAWRNYRKWTRQLGRVKGSRAPDVTNWKALVSAYHDPAKFKKNYVRPGDDNFWLGLRRLYETPNKPSLRYCYSIASGLAAKSGIADIPTYDQVKHWYTVHADKRAVLLAREGDEYARLHLIGYIEREAPPVDDCWFSDHHIFDAAVKVWDEKAGAFKPVRPWLTAWLDWGSLDFVGVLIRAVDPNRDAIERCFKNAIRANGMTPPRHVYVDNGKDFKAAGFARVKDDDRQRIQSVCEQLGVQSHFAIPYNARAKVIERMFGIVCGQFSKLWKSYRGSTPADRPESADAAWKDVENLPTLEQFDSAFRQWLDGFYRKAKSTGRILNGKSPAEVRAAAKALRSPVSGEDLDRAFLRTLPGAARVIHAGGVVHALGRNFQSDALWQLMAKTRFVVLKVDPDDVSRVFAFTEDGREIGLLQEVRRVAGLVGNDPVQIEELREQTKAIARRNRELKALRKAALGRITGSAATHLFNLPPGETPISHLRLQIAEQEPATPVSPDDLAALAEVDSILHAETAANKDTMFGPELTDEDRADLAAVLEPDEITHHHEER